jgi:hypothetical protein
VHGIFTVLETEDSVLGSSNGAITLSEEKEGASQKNAAFTYDRNKFHAFRHFFIPPIEDLANDFRWNLTRTPPKFRSLADSFNSNCTALFSTVTMPFRIASANYSHQLFHQIFMSEKIRSLKPEFEDKTEDEKKQMAKEIAQRKFSEAMKSEEQRFNGGLAILANLDHLLDDPNMKLAASELLRQSDAMAWGILEVLANDLFIELLNEDPRYTEVLLEDERTKKRFQLRDLSLPLSAYSYNLSKNMGDVLSGLVKIDDVDTMRTVYDVLLPGRQALTAMLRRSELWQLNQRRNLILHRRGIVDALYLKNTGENLTVGDVLIITPEQFEKDLVFVLELGSEFLTSLPPDGVEGVPIS